MKAIIEEKDKNFVPCIVQIKESYEININSIPIGLFLMANRNYIALERHKVQGYPNYCYAIYGLEGYSMDENLFIQPISITNIN